MVFRKDSKIDAFQRQISALRQQLGPVPGEHEDEALYDDRDVDQTEEPAPVRPVNNGGSASTLPVPVDTRAAQAQPYDTDRYTPYSTSARQLDVEADPPAYHSPVADSQTSVIAHDTTWKGDLQTDGTIHVHGRVEGSIRAKQDVFIAEEADVDATITATNVVVAGYVKGSIRCGGRFEALPQARIAGEVQAPTLVVHDGANVTGQFRMGPGEGTEAAKPAVVQRRAARGGD
jgi:cytoskeletal protein CcmA (bactofilin family)